MSPVPDDDKLPHVVVIGAGFGGLSVAQALRRAKVRVTVINRTNHHLFQPLLYQVAMAGLSPADIAAPARAVLSAQKNVRVLLAEVTGFDFAKRTVSTSAGEVKYDYLVVAAGAMNDYFGHDAWEACAPGLKIIEDAIEIRRRVLLAFERAEAKRITGTPPNDHDLTFVVIGGGPTGVELAGAISELARFALARDFRGIDPLQTRVVLVEGGPRVLAAFPEKLSESGVRQLKELGVEVRTSTRVKEIEPDAVVLSDGERIGAAVTLWGAGVRASPLGALMATAASVAKSEAEPLKVDRGGRIPVGKDCALAGFPEVFAIGDMALFMDEHEKPLPGLSPVALQQGRFVARMITRSMKSQSREEFHYVDKGTMATIGRSRAVAWAGPLKVSGLLAWLMWLVVHLFFLITFRNRIAVLFNWTWSYFTYKRGARLITQEAHGTGLKSVA